MTTNLADDATNSVSAEDLNVDTIEVVVDAHRKVATEAEAKPGEDWQGRVG